MAGAPSVPVLVVVITFVGFGALARDVGFDIYQAAFVTAVVFALPGQVVLADEIAHGASLLAATFAVVLTAVRLLPLAFSLMPVLRDGAPRRWQELLLCHFIAITIWLEAMRRLPPLPRHLRTAYFTGFAIVLASAIMSATILGFLLAARVPPPVAAGFVFLTPIYFFLSLVETAVSRADRLAFAVGVVLGPVLFTLAPGYDLFLTGLVGGTGAYLVTRRRRRAGP
jgi:predicted branched-subunit amino acid permease